MSKPISVKISQNDGRTTRTLVSFDVRHDGKTLAKIQQDTKTHRWFWYGVSGPKINTANDPRDFDVVKAEAVAKCKEFVGDTAISRPHRGTEV